MLVIGAERLTQLLDWARAIPPCCLATALVPVIIRASEQESGPDCQQAGL